MAQPEPDLRDHIYAPEDKAEPMSGRLRGAVEWIVIVAAALVAALLIKTFLIQAFFIPSESMDPTLKVRDRVLVNKLSYHLHSVHRGDIVVFKRPPGETGDAAVKDLIKRVIGLPNDNISQTQDGKVLINGKPINEPYTHGKLTIGLNPQKIPPGKIFVMGDNRTNSKDSRVFGPISKSLIVGRAFIRVWPLTSIHLF
jgi:signal peptidase I